ncbi:NUDIX domain-containing protein [Cellvibrio zantedeschiae]|uniref:NUDIX domain-containing protein n=1 Tax=Cellvibrio zantedeschiae TaxID=1237077 RepID=A0ABQ3B908_9GAMM|nr:NUDIX hydrolase [Cellvibrio zantedeschiae]GGY85227.1 NUDIX domain-containing protein [Cellvibrio zantedeschiae]
MDKHFTACKLAYIIDDKLLVYLRDDFAHIPFPNMWDFPGGMREGDETPEQCVLRELEEEFALKLDESRLIYKKVGVNFNNTGNSYFFVAEGKQEEIDAIVFSEEGQYWQMMNIEDFMEHPKAIDRLKSRLADFLAANKN